MRKVVVEVYTSLDGVIQPLDWMPPSETGREERGKYARDQLFASDALLLGRGTYESFANVWSARTVADDGPGEAGFIDRINSMPKFVASRTLEEPLAWNATLIKGDVAQAVAKLKQQPGQDILMYGCGELARTLMQHDLIDEYRFWVYPVVVEEGTRLFGGAGKATLKLVDTKPFSAGFAILTCRPAQRVSQ
ncbi:MAG TPA: dihydrofolate reductase family protein [Ktedonobacterales bacterium]|nr:dihydrofolate reductase family protein [Ktedonobacterales bacterium]